MPNELSSNDGKLRAFPGITDKRKAQASSTRHQAATCAQQRESSAQGRHGAFADQETGARQQKGRCKNVQRRTGAECANATGVRLGVGVRRASYLAGQRRPSQLPANARYIDASSACPARSPQVSNRPVPAWSAARWNTRPGCNVALQTRLATLRGSLRQATAQSAVGLVSCRMGRCLFRFHQQ